MRIALALLLSILTACAVAPIRPSDPDCATFSIVAFDPTTQELGIAVASRVIGVGAVVPYAKAGVGAIATQAAANPRYGPDGLALLADGRSAEATVAELTKADDGRARRQLGIVDARGGAASFSGDGCNAWAGGIVGGGFCVQGNILAGEAVVKAMAESFRASEGLLEDRLVAALAAGEAAGGDRRGKQSAALLVVREGYGYARGNDRYRDVRVDEHEDPITELKRILALHQRMFRRPRD
ncbi:MAG: DUF1028 domain-containing protein [Planctomycetes bacterium]|nr:DUF1028 domain-containing protein [Planctomycetota bacterium]